MSIAVAPNKIYKTAQEIDFADENIITLIGENGCGKSAILEKVFTDYISDNNLLLISFTSGQNESFSEIFQEHLKKSKRFLINSFSQTVDDETETVRQVSLNSFHFDLSWVRILIFFATTIKADGLTRRFLVQKNIIDVSPDFSKDDLSTFLTFKIRILTRYLYKLQSDDALESKDSNRLPIRKSIIHQLLEKLMNKLEPNYDFLRTSNTKYHRLTSLDAFRVFGKNVQDIFTFLGYALRNDTLLVNDSFGLFFKGNLELNNLSDGEFQLLSVYALIDLFDGPQTLFLFDEIDSHIHYLNTKKLWESLKLIQGKLLTTTHSADSILLHQPKNIRLVSSGKIEEELTAEHLFKRLSSLSENETYKFKVAAKFDYLAIVENKFDWFLFNELAKQKLPNYNPVLINKIQIVERSSTTNLNGTDFGIAKFMWVKELLSVEKRPSNKAIFLICDKDGLNVGNIMQDGVSVSYNDQVVKNLGGKGQKVFLLSWKRREIENYLICHSLLNKSNLLHQISEHVSPANAPRENYNCDNPHIQELDVKSIFQPLYLRDGEEIMDTHERYIDFDKVTELVSAIPPEEISEDIVNMYNFIISKMTIA